METNFFAIKFALSAPQLKFVSRLHISVQHVDDAFGFEVKATCTLVDIPDCRSKGKGKVAPMP
jgi:hypothetical protein